MRMGDRVRRLFDATGPNGEIKPGTTGTVVGFYASYASGEAYVDVDYDGFGVWPGNSIDRLEPE